MSERRSFGRKKLYFSEDFRVQVLVSGHVWSGFLMDVSPAGAGIALKYPKARVVLDTGSRVEVAFDLPGKNSPLVMKATVSAIQERRVSGGVMTRLGVSFDSFHENTKHASDEVPMGDVKFSCSEFLTPSVWCEHPWLYHEKLMFRVVDFGSLSMTLETSVRNKVLLPGMILNAFLAFPGQPVNECVLEVVSVGQVASSKERFSVFVKFASVSTVLGQAVASYCLMVDSTATLAGLHSAGFVLARASEVALVDYVHSESDVTQVLNLRRCFDEFDDMARQVMCKIGAKVVGCARVIFNDGRRERSSLASRALLPGELWSDGFLELSGFVVRAEWMQSDIVDEIIRFLLRVAFQSPVRWLVAECSVDLLDRCLAMGAQDLKRKVVSSDGVTEVLCLVRWDVKAIKAGWGGNAEQWTSSFGPIVKHMTQHGSIDASSRVRIRMALGEYAKTDAGKKLIKKRTLHDSKD